MFNQYVIDSGSVGVLRSSSLLLDTNFLIDAYIFKVEAADLVEKFRDLKCELLTTQAVITEFLGGTKSEIEFKAKVAHLELLFADNLDVVALPAENSLPSSMEFLDFSRQCKSFSATDFELYLMLKRYKQSGLKLITRNHLDFTDKICNRAGFITLLGSKEIRTYGIYAAS